jgi:hypothetical protein
VANFSHQLRREVTVLHVGRLANGANQWAEHVDADAAFAGRPLFLSRARSSEARAE